VQSSGPTVCVSGGHETWQKKRPDVKSAVGAESAGAGAWPLHAVLGVSLTNVQQIYSCNYGRYVRHADGFDAIPTGILDSSMMIYHRSDSARRLRPATPTKQKGQHKPSDKSADESSKDPDDDCADEADADPSNDSVSEKTCDATDDDP